MERDIHGYVWRMSALQWLRGEPGESTSNQKPRERARRSQDLGEASTSNWTRTCETQERGSQCLSAGTGGVERSLATTNMAQ